MGIETNDDAAVYRLTDETALVVTADFIPSPVDDAYLFGQIAAANSLSDVYAMGGKPLTALNLCMFPVKAGKDVLARSAISHRHRRHRIRPDGLRDHLPDDADPGALYRGECEAAIYRFVD